MQIIEVTGFGVRSAAIQLRRRDTPMRFTLFPMIHMGAQSFYDDVTARLRSADVIVVEGVHGRSSVLVGALTMSYRVLRFNRHTNLVRQHIDYRALGKPILHPDITVEEFTEDWRKIPLRMRLMMWCVLPLVIVGQLFGGTKAIWSQAVECGDLPTPEEEELAMEEFDTAFLGRRDERLLAALGKLHATRSTERIEVAVVYGAGHMAAVVNGLSRLGYRATGADWMTVVDL